MRVALVAVALAGLLAAPVATQQPAKTGRDVLVFIDDLHLDFRLTPRMRDLLKRLLLTGAIREGDRVGVVSTGYSSISEAPTLDRSVIESVINRVTGGGFRPEEVLEAISPTGDDREVRKRAHVSLTTAYDAIRSFGRLTAGRRAVIYVSNGHRLPSEPPELQDVVRVANDAQAPIYVFLPLDLVAQPAWVLWPDSDAWRQYVNESRETVRVLAASTGGLMVSTMTDFDYAVSVLAR
jgi:hypothetical protein